MLPQSHVKDPGHSAKSAGGRLQVNTCIHLMYVALHGVTWCMLYGVHRTFAETAAVSCGTSHASAVSTPLQWISVKKRTIKKLVTRVESHASTVSLLESME